MYVAPTLFVNKLIDAFCMVLLKTPLMPVLLGLLVAAIVLAFFVKICR